MAALAERRGDEETGGMLLGFEGADRPDELVVTGLIGPGPKAKHRRYGFNPDGHWQREQLGHLYAASGRISTFVGDWHSHPHGLPVPSQTDEATARRIAENPAARAPRPLTLIVGRDSDDEWLVAAFRFDDAGLVQSKLRVFDAESEDLLVALEPRRLLAGRGRRGLNVLHAAVPPFGKAPARK
jgi:integrative and conjugative element protein (TIGR02256 family)